MTKRRLSKTQARRIRQQQRDSASRMAEEDSGKRRSRKASLAKSSASRSPDTIDEGALGPEQLGRVVAHFGTQVDVEAGNQPAVRCFMRANLDSIVTGDNIVWRNGPDTGVVVSCQTRSSLLSRPDSYGKLKPVAANIDQIIITVAPKPETHTNLIDRYLVVAEINNIVPVILINKADLIDDENHQTFDEIEKVYRALGYQIIKTSAKQQQGMEPLIELLAGKTSIFVGQSGVGKSSIIQQLVPEHDILVGQLSSAKDKGRHTTTHSQLFHFKQGGQCIDSPGIREFGLWHLSHDDVIQGFIELRELAQHCKFRDCKHNGEPGCAVREGIENNTVTPQRFNSYQRIVASLDDVEMKTTND